MRILHIAAAVAVAAQTPVSALQAQDTLRVLRHTPGDTAKPTNLVTVTFDRPVASALDRTISAERLFRIEPAIAGSVAWRDPVTIRFIPAEPMTPGARFTVTIDTAVRGLDGSKLEQPYRFAFHVPGPRLLARRFDEFDAAGALAPDGRMSVLYSAPIDFALLRGRARVELVRCARAPQTVALRPTAQRAVVPTDPYVYQSRRPPGSDSTAARFQRVVELEPVTPLPNDCSGEVVLPTTVDDSIFGREERYSISTARTFRLDTLTCPLPDPVCRSNLLVVRFASPARQADVLAHIRLNSQPVQLASQPEESRVWTLTVPVAPRTRYVIDADDGMRDIYGRALEGGRQLSLTTADYEPALTSARGVLTVPRSGPATFPVRSVNASAARIITYTIPEDLRSAMLSEASSYFDLRSLLPKVRAETTTVALNASLNATTMTQVPLPRAALALEHPMVVAIVEVQTPLPDAMPPAVAKKSGTPPLGWPQNYPPQTRAILQVTDLAVTAKPLGALDGAVFVTDLATGRPRRGVTVTQRVPSGMVVGRGVTDTDGLATLSRVANPAPAAPQTQVTVPPKYPPVTVIEATTNDDRVSIALGVGRAIGYESANPLNLNLLGGNLDASPLARGAVVPDRDIVRPGEVLHLKGVVRRGVLGALTIPSSDSARLTIHKKLIRWNDVDTVGVRDTVLRTSRYGSVVDSVALGSTLPLGEYSADLQVIVDGGWRSIARADIRLAEYRAPEFLVDVTSDEAARFADDTVRIGVSAKYLLGVPMGRVAVKWSAVAWDAWFDDIPLPWAKGWILGGPPLASARTEPRTLSGVDTLELNGRFALRLPVAAFQRTLPGNVEVNIAVTDVNRQVVTAEGSATISPGRLYLLARWSAASSVSRVGEPARFVVRAVNERGVAQSGVPIRVTIRSGHAVAPTPGAAGRWVVDTLVARTMASGVQPVGVDFTPPTPGHYDIELSAVGHDGAEARTTFSRDVAVVDAPREEPGYQLRLFAERSRLAPGQNARVHFVSPVADGDAWVTVEREGILEQRRVRAARGDNLVTLPITERYAPNVFVGVALVPRSDAAVRPDSSNQRLRAGYVKLVIDTSGRRLDVSVAVDRASYQPRDTAVISVAVRDAAARGVRSEVAVWAVDEGVLALTGYTIPHVLRDLYRERGVGEQLWSSLPTLLTTDPRQSAAFMVPTRMMLSSSVSSLTVSANEGPVTTRSEFRSTAFYLGAIETDVRGRATVRPRLPDNLTTFRVVAVAMSADDRYGSGDTTLLVTRPLAARPSLPRFVRPSDSLVAGAVINARDGAARLVDVNARASGAAIHGPAHMSVSLSPGAAGEARFNFLIPPRKEAGDSVVVAFDARDAANADAVETRLPVRPDFSPRTHGRIGAVRDTADVVMSLPAEIDPARSRMRLRIGTSPLSTMLAAYRWLRAYRFDCTEQISSVGRSMIAVWRATKATNPNALGGDPRPKLEELVDAIVARQNANGSIRYWNDFRWTSPWLTAYAGEFLLEARAAGIQVDSKVISRISSYLRAKLPVSVDSGGMNRFERVERKLNFGRNVAAVEFLRRAGEPDTARERSLLRVSRGMTWEDRLRLAEVIAPRPDVRVDAEAIVDAALKAITVVGRRVDLPDTAMSIREFPSRVAPASRLLTATLALRPQHPLIGPLIETVLQQGRAESAIAWSTQDYASVVLALAAFADIDPVDRIVQARVGSAMFRARRPATGVDSSIVVPLTGLLENGPGGRPQLRVHLDASDANKTIYFALEVDEVPLAPPVKPDIQGIVVERWYERFSDGTPVTAVQEGDLVRVRLRITVPADRQFVVVEDPLPAGLEPVDFNLKTSSSLDAFATPQSEAARLQVDPDESRSIFQSWLYGTWDQGQWSPWQHREMRDDRVVYVARLLWTGSYTATYVARATTAGSFVAPPAHAEEMYNPAAQGRTSGGRFLIGVRP